MQVGYRKYSRWRLSPQAHSGGSALNTIQRYELIRPILKGEKTPKQVSEEKNFPISTIYYHLKGYQEDGGNMESLAAHTHTACRNSCKRPLIPFKENNGTWQILNTLADKLPVAQHVSLIN